MTYSFSTSRSTESTKLNICNLVDFDREIDRAVDAVDSVDFNKIDRVEVDFVASVYEAL